jgi:hypothetical protein
MSTTNVVALIKASFTLFSRTDFRSFIQQNRTGLCFGKSCDERRLGLLMHHLQRRQIKDHTLSPRNALRTAGDANFRCQHPFPPQMVLSSLTFNAAYRPEQPVNPHAGTFTKTRAFLRRFRLDTSCAL